IVGPPPTSALFPYTTLFRSRLVDQALAHERQQRQQRRRRVTARVRDQLGGGEPGARDLGETVHRLRRQPEIGRQVDGALAGGARSEEHTSELQSLRHLVCRL